MGSCQLVIKEACQQRYPVLSAFSWPLASLLARKIPRSCQSCFSSASPATMLLCLGGLTSRRQLLQALSQDLEALVKPLLVLILKTLTKKQEMEDQMMTLMLQLMLVLLLMMQVPLILMPMLKLPLVLMKKLLLLQLLPSAPTPLLQLYIGQPLLFTDLPLLFTSQHLPQLLSSQPLQLLTSPMLTPTLLRMLSTPTSTLSKMTTVAMTLGLRKPGRESSPMGSIMCSCLMGGSRLSPTLSMVETAMWLMFSMLGRLSTQWL